MAGTMFGIDIPVLRERTNTPLLPGRLAPELEAQVEKKKKLTNILFGRQIAYCWRRSRKG